MIRKQVYLTPEIDRELMVTARREGKTVAEVIREILGAKLKVKAKKEQAGAVLLRMAENAFKGSGDLSANLSGYLYGEKSLNYGRNKPALTKAEEKRAERFIHEYRKKTTR